MAAHLTGIYLHVVADVIKNIREDFLSSNVDESVLRDLQSLWELKMMQEGVIQGCHGDMSYAGSVGGGHPASTSIHDLNMPYAGETPTADLLFPPTPVHTPLPTFGPGSEHPDTVNATDISIGRPAAYMPSPRVNQKPDMNVGMTPKLDMNVAYEGGDEEEPANGHPLVTKDFLPPSIGKRKRENNFPSGSYFPQQDGAGDLITMPLSLEQSLRGDELHKPLLIETPTALYAKKTISTCIDCCKVQERNSTAVDSPHTAMHTLFPQVDGIDDHYDDDVAEEDYNDDAGEDEFEPAREAIARAEGGESAGAEPEPPLNGAEPEPPLNEDDDLDDLDEFDVGETQYEAVNVICSQFEKVNRVKTKWKCSLNNGIMILNNREFVFSKANGEFEF